MYKENKHQFAKFQLSITILLIYFLAITGTTYAYFAIKASNNNTITGNMATVDLTLTVTKVFPKSGISTTNVFVPQLSNDAALGKALRGACVDLNANLACQVYKVIVQNNGGTATEVVDGKISFFGNQSLTTNIATTMPNLKWKLLKSVDETTPINSVLGPNANHVASSTATNFVNEVTLVTNASFTYYIMVWIDEIGSDQYNLDGDKSFYGNILFESSNGTGVTSTFHG